MEIEPKDNMAFFMPNSANLVVRFGLQSKLRAAREGAFGDEQQRATGGSDRLWEVYHGTVGMWFLEN